MAAIIVVITLKKGPESNRKNNYFLDGKKIGDKIVYKLLSSLARSGAYSIETRVSG